VPDAAHEAMRDLVRARATARRVLGKARQHLQGFLLRHCRIYRADQAEIDDRQPGRSSAICRTQLSPLSTPKPNACESPTTTTSARSGQGS
jgi:hypothetical protein